MMQTDAKPFVKWAGGKGQLLDEIDLRLGRMMEKHPSCLYVEPFVGGGAVLFHVLKHYQSVQKAIINDINPRLITTYRVIQQSPCDLLQKLAELQQRYYPLSHDDRTSMYMAERKRFNDGNLDDVDVAALFIFLNRTCFNGLYRENSKGGFNVPHGRYANPNLCDEKTILADSEALQKVEIMCGDFSGTGIFAGADTVYYFDPPYKPLSETSSFNTYVKQPFDDADQVRLRDFCNFVSRKGSGFVLSNSDVKGKNPADNFFDDLYADYIISRVFATRMVNANPDKRGKLTELLITNAVRR